MCQTTNYCTNVLRADLGKVLTENIWDNWKKKGNTILQEALDSSGLASDLSTFEAFFESLFRQIKHPLSSLNISDHIFMYFCPGLMEISASRTDPLELFTVLVQHIKEHSAGMTHSSLSSFPWFFHFVILSSLWSFAFWLLRALAFVSLLLRLSVLPG